VSIEEVTRTIVGLLIDQGPKEQIDWHLSTIPVHELTAANIQKLTREIDAIGLLSRHEHNTHDILTSLNGVHGREMVIRYIQSKLKFGMPK